MILRTFLIVTAALGIASCTTLFPTGFGERDRFVVNTPTYFDNQIFYVAPTSSGGGYPLMRSDQLKPDPKTDIPHGSPLTIILNSVTLPPSNDERTMDIAVMLEIGTEQSGKSQPILAWYQRGVHPDQPLNFSNLLLHFEPRWDSRVAPSFRIRVVDVTSEKNAETREALAQVGTLANAVSPFIPGANAAAISLGVRAASLVAANASNRQLLDYSVQFYSDETIQASYGGDLTPLRRGRILLIGRPTWTAGADGKPVPTASSYWSGFNGTLDPATRNVLSTGTPVHSPVVTLTVSIAQSIVPAIVAQRSTYLTTLLNTAQQTDLTAIQAAGRSVYDGSRTFAAIENLRRNRDPASLRTLIEMEQNAGADKVSDDDKALIRGTLKELTKCNVGSSADVQHWKTSNPNGFAFEDGKFKLKGDVCPS